MITLTLLIANDTAAADDNRLIMLMTKVKTRREEKSNKKVSKADKSRTLLRYSITYHYDLISLSTSDANQKNSCIRR